MPDRKLRAFLCHASQDKSVVRKLYQQLCTEGWIDPWLDEEKLLPGMDWDVEIEKAVESADVVIVCLSNNSVNKEGYVQKELRFVLNLADEKPEETIFIIPLRLDDCLVPRRLRGWQYADYFPKDNRSIAYRRLINSMQVRAKAMGVNVKETSLPSISKGSIKSKQKPKTFEMNDGMRKEFAIHYSINGHEIYTFGQIEFVKISVDINEIIDISRQLQVPLYYWIGRFPVTNSQYAIFAKATLLDFQIPHRKDLHPVVNISWEDIQRYLHWLNSTYKSDLPLHFEYQLPSEAEWENAARGNDHRVYPWGNNYIRELCNSEKKIEGSTTPVGAYSPQGDSPYGVADMAGNVWELTRSLYANGSSDYVLRGGSYFSSHLYVRCDARRNTSSTLRIPYYGFRVAVVPLK